jgi:hypothetical protein
VSPQKHQIGRQVFEIEVSSEAAAQRLHAELGALQRQVIEPLMDRICTELSSPDRVHRMARVEVDLGELDAEHLERDLLDKLGPALRETLAERIRAVEQEAALLGEDPATSARLELISLFARTGTLPFWAEASNPRVVDEALAALLVRGAPEVCALVRWLAHDRRSVMRLSRHVEAPRLVGLFRALVEERARAAAEARTAELWELLAAAQAATPSVPVSSVGAGVLAAVCLGDSRAESQGAFWREALGYVGMEAGVSYRALVGGLRGVLRSSIRFGAVVRALWEELPEAASEAHVDGKATASKSMVTAEESMAAAEELMVAAAEPMPTASESIATASKSMPTAAASAPTRVPARRPAPPPPRPSPDADEAYVDNAGLVIVWPFLASFFEHLGLMAKRCFLDSRCLHRGVGLLHHAATLSLNPPEYQLTLTKILCGMPLDEPFDFGPPVTDAESAECSTLFSSVLVNAPMLGDMDAAALRDAFLLRKGIVRARGEAFLLSVERAPHDLVLEKLPWPLGWVMNPWMQAPLCVAWLP